MRAESGSDLSVFFEVDDTLENGKGGKIGWFDTV